MVNYNKDICKIMYGYLRYEYIFDLKFEFFKRNSRIFTKYEWLVSFF